MSTRLVGWALRDAPLEHADLSMGARLLLVYLADHFNEDEGAAWPSQHRLARYMGCSDRAIRRYLDELVDAKIVNKTQREGKSLIYRFGLPPRTNCPGSPRTNIPVTPDKLSGHPGQIVRLTNKEPIKEKRPDTLIEPIEPQELATLLANVRKELKIASPK